MGESYANRTGGGPQKKLSLVVWFMENFGLPELPHKKLSNLSSQSSVCLPRQQGQTNYPYRQLIVSSCFLRNFMWILLRIRCTPLCQSVLRQSTLIHDTLKIYFAWRSSRDLLVSVRSLPKQVDRQTWESLHNWKKVCEVLT